MRKVSIAGMIMSVNGVTLFMSNGMPEVLTNADWRTVELVQAIAKNSVDNPGKPYETDLDGWTAIDVINKAGVGVTIEKDGDKTTVEVKSEATGEIKKIEIGNNLDDHYEELASGEGAKGFAAFMTRFAERTCTLGSAELLAFMKRTDLPIADDGSIIAYKILKKSDTEGIFVDPHSRKIKQKVGSLVEQANYDPSSRNLCSTGLHVCYKDYCSGFQYDVLTLIKINPEDCIAHDLGQHKMRVRKYHIVAILPDTAYNDIKGGKSARDTLGSTVLEAVVAGDHPPILEHVLIKGARGEDVVYTPIENEAAKKAEAAQKAAVSKKRRSVVKNAKKAQHDVKAVKAIVSGKKANDNDKKPTKASKAPTKIEPKSKAAKKMAAQTSAAADKELKARVDKAFKLKEKGLSIRAIAKEIHMDRDAIREWLDGTRKFAA